MPGDADLALAQQVVVEYARTLERDLSENNLPARVDAFPFAKAVIKDAIETSVTYLSSTSSLTDELRDFFETAGTWNRPRRAAFDYLFSFRGWFSEFPSEISTRRPRLD